MKDIIHFAHGNGFPSSCYRQLFATLESDYDVYSIEKIGHNSQFPVTENWHYLVLELIDSIEQLPHTPVIAMGHSLGGVLSTVAAIERPDLIKKVILIDSPLIGRFKSNLVRLAKALGIIDRVTPAQRTKGRRAHWQTREQVLSYLSQRDLFKTFSQACLEDYVDYGLEKNEEGYFLRFDRHIEYLIYRTLPHTLHRYEGALTVPALLIYGESSTVVTASDAKYMERTYHMEAQALPGTHMLPMEAPETVAKVVGQWLRD